MRRLLYVIGAMALVACGDPSTARDTASGNPAAAEPAVTSPSAAVVPAALSFSAARVGGGTIKLADYSGKTVLLWFWAPT